MKQVFLVVAGVILAMGCAGVVQAAVYTDDFNRADQQLGDWSSWAIGAGDKNWHRIANGVVVADTPSPVPAEAIVGDRYLLHTQTTETYQKAAIDFMLPQFDLPWSGRYYRPQIQLKLNFKGQGNYWLCADDYEIALRGNADFNVRKLDAGGGELFATGYNNIVGGGGDGGGLMADTWYRLELIKADNLITGNVKTLTGSVLGTGSFTDTGAQLSGGWTTIADNYAGFSVSSVQWDNFQFELSNVPEPGSLATMGGMIAGLAIAGFRRRRSI